MADFYDYDYNSDYESNNAVRNELLDNETILWQGTSNGNFHMPGSKFLTLFGLFFGIIPLFMLFGIISSNMGPSTFVAIPFVSIFVIVGFFLAFGMKRMIKKRLKKSIYVITNQRVLEIYQGRYTKTKSLTLKELDNLEKLERQDGSGDIIFKRTYQYGGYNYNTRYGNGVSTTGFFGIDNVSEVYRILNNAISNL